MRVVKPFGRGLASDLVRVSLCDTNQDVVRSLLVHFGDAAGVEILEGHLLELDGDALVSPANSFGDMGGGIDLLIDRHFGGEAQRRVMAAIAEHFLGELPVGTALVVPMTTGRFSFLIPAPTMRVPGNVRGSINGYLAMRAALVAIHKHNRSDPGSIRSVAVPGLGTGVGGMSFDDAARQMRAAYDAIIGGEWERVAHPAMAPFALGNDHTFRLSDPGRPDPRSSPPG